MTFEAVLANDPHIVDEEPGIHPLDVIVNDLDFRLADAPVTGEVFELLNGGDVVRGWANDRQQLEAALTAAENESGEGAVFRDAAGRWTKVKSKRYSYLKSLRTPLLWVAAGKVDSLGQRFTVEEVKLRDAGAWERLPDYLVTTPSGQQALRLPDLARAAQL